MPRNTQPHSLVVGGTRGIGRAVSQALLEAGHNVSVLGRGRGTGRWPKAARLWQADLANLRTLPSLASGIVKASGPLQSLVFVQRFRGTGDLWQGELDVSLNATRVLIDSLQDKFAAGRSNAIVVVGSIANRLVAAEQPLSYHVAKGALLQLVRYYACALGPSGIRVNSVSPGVILKPEAQPYYRLNSKLAALYARLSPLRRFGAAAEVATVVRFLCGHDSSFITGQDITVDGGISLQWQASLARELVPILEKKLPLSEKRPSEPPTQNFKTPQKAPNRSRN